MAHVEPLHHWTFNTNIITIIGCFLNFLQELMDILEEEVEEERRRIDSEDVSSSGYCMHNLSVPLRCMYTCTCMLYTLYMYYACNAGIHVHVHVFVPVCCIYMYVLFMSSVCVLVCI